MHVGTDVKISIDLGLDPPTQQLYIVLSQGNNSNVAYVQRP